MVVMVVVNMVRMKAYDHGGRVDLNATTAHVMRLKTENCMYAVPAKLTRMRR